MPRRNSNNKSVVVAVNYIAHAKTHLLAVLRLYPKAIFPFPRRIVRQGKNQGASLAAIAESDSFDLGNLSTFRSLPRSRGPCAHGTTVPFCRVLPEEYRILMASPVPCVPCRTR